MDKTLKGILQDMNLKSKRIISGRQQKWPCIIPYVGSLAQFIDDFEQVITKSEYEYFLNRSILRADSQHFTQHFFLVCHDLSCSDDTLVLYTYPRHDVFLVEKSLDLPQRNAHD